MKYKMNTNTKEEQFFSKQKLKYTVRFLYKKSNQVSTKNQNEIETKEKVANDANCSIATRPNLISQRHPRQWRQKLVVILPQVYSLLLYNLRVSIRSNGCEIRLLKI